MFLITWFNIVRTYVQHNIFFINEKAMSLKTHNTYLRKFIYMRIQIQIFHIII